MTKRLCGDRMEQTERPTEWSHFRKETGSWIVIVSLILDGYKIVISENLDNILNVAAYLYLYLTHFKTNSIVSVPNENKSLLAVIINT